MHFSYTDSRDLGSQVVVWSLLLKQAVTHCEDWAEAPVVRTRKMVVRKAQERLIACFILTMDLDGYVKEVGFFFPE